MWIECEQKCSSIKPKHLFPMQSMLPGDLSLSYSLLRKVSFQTKEHKIINLFSASISDLYGIKLN